MSCPDNLKIGIAFDTNSLIRFKDCDAVIYFGDEPEEVNTPLVIVNQDYKIKFCNFPIIDREKSAEYIRITSYWLHEIYKKPYAYIEKRFHDLPTKVNIFEIIKRRKKYFNIAIALCVPIFFLYEGIPLSKPFIPYGFYNIKEKFPLSVYKWILSPLAYFFAVSEYRVDMHVGFSLKSKMEIVRSFLSFLCWEETELYFSYVEFFMQFLKKKLDVWL